MYGQSRDLPSRDDDVTKVMEALEAKVVALQEKVMHSDRPPAYLRALSHEVHDFGMPANDAQLKESFDIDNTVVKQGNNDALVKELMTRLSELEDNQPEFKGLNTWDVPMPLVPSTATLGEVIKVVNQLIQRTQRQDRLK